MGFSFGLGSDVMANQLQKDATLFKLNDISTNIQKRDVTLGNAAAYVDYSFSHLSRFMLLDEANDSASVFLNEYQALLRTRIQQLITDLTAAMTRDIDKALTDTRTDWEQSGPRRGAQGYTSANGDDAGASRVSYNYFTGFAQNATPSGGGTNTAPSTAPYKGQPMWDGIERVSPDTQSDAVFDQLRVFGTAALQQGAPDDGFTEAILDTLNVVHQNNAVLYGETGGGFVTHLNKYSFTDVAANRFDTQNIVYTNTTNSRNLNDEKWDGVGADFVSGGGNTADIQQFDRNGRAKNEFERILWDAIAEFDRKNYLRDMFRLSDQNGFFNDVQIASTSSLNSGSQAQNSVFLEFVPSFGGTGTDANSDGTLSNTERFRPDLGGQIRIVFDRWSAFFHS
ncbi:hypothetical protein COW36_23265 [bacterium (Candidatus Blackallbacteria) CG17_big_fil_post_rev_8_21_14_2_50_48_46]|uniref:Uncharacterized protein n=1 Tax=bacterium (Candidatus Blackallbacteria) CG17_big_fil_post_rev_8_21_14_2_50_48_46 TaxID=2014261 RepID=A0A2M7FXF3_9BACT|nr:MAG: hypothetical protein COW64_17480 [bacterium (Candidatus Blackallbacteria) CG18_big_fil_WC_8_21_14_2_50_49_26]PIW13964.1 MAG: hypothetical protein COW36_23265 [bacterium (Candidatus Blackallbacteria) CG17_big_fil_post_rev_8_21_14_2_50_48_46]PIW46815.1 MAG: hypothetical protein COW20_14445 [bacterium (Candidatus Blackallbacteria) CG13_big_fil_rev_8_21_14_2_50_49_14]